MTAHGGTNPNASCSRLVSRMVISSALAPARLSLAPCSPPSRTLRAASRWPAAILDRSCAQRLRELRPGRRNGYQPNRETPDQPRDWLSLPTPNSEEAHILTSRSIEHDLVPSPKLLEEGAGEAPVGRLAANLCNGAFPV